MNLRPYQEQAIAALVAELERGHNRLLMQMATGLGKTRTFSALLDHPLLQAWRSELAQAAGDGAAIGRVAVSEDSAYAGYQARGGSRPAEPRQSKEWSVNAARHDGPQSHYFVACVMGLLYLPRRVVSSHRKRDFPREEHLIMAKQLICEGQCNQGVVQEFDNLIRHYGRTEFPNDKGDNVSTSAAPGYVLGMARGLIYTSHVDRGPDERGYGVHRCSVCGTERRY